jgi:glycerol-3-phosphate acyltransferase PlsY
LIIAFAFLLIGAYLLGSVPTAYLVARWRRGIDIRRFGSGNIGASNVLAAGSRWTSLIVIGFDFLKGAAPVALARAINMPVYQQVAVGMAAICGHNWTVFLRFSGGRGVLTTLGVVFALAPWLALALLLINFAFAPFKQFALGTLVVLILLPVFSWFLADPFHIERSLQLSLGYVAILLLLLVRRLTAARSELAATVSTRELVIYRLVFDRDIRDRRLWLSRRASQANGAER